MLEVEVNTRKLEKAIRRVPKVLKTEFGDAFDHIGRHFLKDFKQKRLQGPPGVKARPHGIFTRFKRVSLPAFSGIENMGMAIFTDSEIAKRHEEGAVIRAKGGGKLAVPLSMRTEMWTASGRLKKRYKQPGQLKNVEAIILRGKPFLAKVKKRTKEILPLFVLKNRIKIKPRLGFFSTWQGQENWRLERLNKAVSKALQKA